MIPPWLVGFAVAIAHALDAFTARSCLKNGEKISTEIIDSAAMATKLDQREAERAAGTATADHRPPRLVRLVKAVMA